MGLFGYRASICGHRTRRKGRVSAFCRTIKLKMPLNYEGGVDYCLKCIGEMTIRCALCREPIFIGSPVSLKIPVDQDFKVPEHSVIYRHKPLTVITCLGVDCADGAIDMCGRWLPDRGGKGHIVLALPPDRYLPKASSPTRVEIQER